MSRMKSSGKRTPRIKLDPLKVKTLTDEERESVKGGAELPKPPGGPIPIPYPNFRKS